MMYREAAACTAKCYAEGRAAGNANMRLHHRTEWNREDYDIATVVTEICLMGDPDKTEAELFDKSANLPNVAALWLLSSLYKSFTAKAKLLA